MKRAPLSTLFVLVGLVSVSAQTAEEKKATIAYLHKLQQPDGSYLSSLPPAGSAAPGGDLRSTSAALRALKYFGGEPKDVKATAKYVASCFDKESGGFGLRPGAKPDVFLTAVGLMAVVELKMPTDPYVEPAIKFFGANAKGFEEVRIAAAGLAAVGKRAPQTDAWLEQIGKLRNADGTFGKGPGTARDTGGAVAAVLRLGGKVDNRDVVVKSLKSGQRADGGFGKEESQASDLETSYRVMRACHMLKEKPDAAKFHAFVAKCRNADGGYGIAPGQPSRVGPTYFASIILHWLDEKPK